MDFFPIWCDNRCYCTLHFDTNLIDLDVDSRSQQCKKTKTSAPTIPQFSIDFSGMWYTVETCWCGEAHSHTHLCWSFTIQGREPYLCDIVGKKVFKHLKTKLGLVKEITKFYVLTPIWMTLTFIQGHSCMGSQKRVTIFSQNFNLTIGLDEIQYVATIWFVEAHADYILHKNNQGGEMCWRDFIKYTLNMVMCQDSCELICLKFCMMHNTTKLCNLIPV